jgi:hypothetical protein
MGALLTTGGLVAFGAAERRVKRRALLKRNGCGAHPVTAPSLLGWGRTDREPAVTRLPRIVAPSALLWPQ